MQPSRLQRLLTGSLAEAIVVISFFLFVMLRAASWYASATEGWHTEDLGGDFLTFYSGGSFLLQGRLEDVYDVYKIQSFETSLGMSKEMYGVFYNPPFAALLYAPFALFSYPIALTLWLLCNAIALLASLRLLQKYLPGLRDYPYRRLLWLASLFHFTYFWFYFGQISPILLLLYTAFFVLLREKKDLSAGLVLGLLLIKPQLGIVPVVVLLLQKRWKAFLGGAATGFVWLVLSLLLFPEALVRFASASQEFPAMLREATFRLQFSNLHGFALLLLDRVSPTAANILSFSCIATALAYLGKLWWRSPIATASRAWDLRMAASLTLALLCSLHLLCYDLMLMLLPLAIVLHCYPRQERPWLDQGPLLTWTSLLVLVSIASTYLLQIWGWLCKTLGWPEIALQLQVIVGVIWVIVVANASRREELQG